MDAVAKISRRRFVATSLGAGVATACGGGMGNSDGGSSGASADGSDGSGSDASSSMTPGTSAGDESSTSAGGNQPPEWSEIPDQAIVVGEAFMLDLAEFVEDPDGDGLAFAQVAGELPDGLELVGSVISGTPTATGNFLMLQFSADDGGE